MGKIINMGGVPNSGKSSSLTTLDPETAYVISVLKKEHPDTEFTKKFNAEKKNFKQTKSLLEIKAVIEAVDKTPKYKTVVVDDFGFTLMKDVMAKTKTKGFDKYTDLAYDVSQVFDAIESARPDLTVILCWHVKDDHSDVFIPGNMINKYIKPLALSNYFFQYIAEVNPMTGKVEHNIYTSKTTTPQGIEVLLARSPKDDNLEEAEPCDLNAILQKINK